MTRNDHRLVTTAILEIDRLESEVRSAAKAQVEGVAKIDRLIDISTGLKRLAESRKGFMKLRNILSSLHYTKMTARRSQILDAHEKTFEWMLQRSASGQDPGLLT